MRLTSHFTLVKKTRDIRMRIHENIGKNVLGGKRPFFPTDADLRYESNDVPKSRKMHVQFVAFNVAFKKINCCV